MKSIVGLMVLMSASCFADTLFVCTGNTARSYMAEVIANEKLHHASFSRGIDVTKLYPEKKASEALSDWDLYQFHIARQIKINDLENADTVLTMTQDQKKYLQHQYPEYSSKIKMISECAMGKRRDVTDPYGKTLLYYKKARDQINAYENMISSRAWKCIRP